MTGNKSKNVGICHSCRSTGFLGECPRKSRYPWCGCGFLKCFKVEKETNNKGKLFKCCALKCGYFDWIKVAESSGVVGHDDSSSANCPGKDETKYLSGIFQSLARISAKEEVEISVSESAREMQVRNNAFVVDVRLLF